MFYYFESTPLLINPISCCDGGSYSSIKYPSTDPKNIHIIESIYFYLFIISDHYQSIRLDRHFWLQYKRFP